jgi:hypothetical protein
MARTAGGESGYLVGRAREELWSPTARIHVHEGLTLARAHAGVDHPLIRALAPSGRATRIADGTLGLAQDALHIAATLGASILASEISPVVYSLCEEGLARLATASRVSEAARRIEIRLGPCAEVLATEPSDSLDAVLLAPMFVNPDRAPPGYDAFRGAARHSPVDAATLEQALRVAPRVVVKARPGEPIPPALQHHSRSQIDGKALQYWVFGR